MKLESGRVRIMKKEPGVEDTLSGAKISVKAEQKSSKPNSTNLKIQNAYIGVNGALSIIKKEPRAEDLRAKRNVKPEEKSSKLNSTKLETWHAFIGAQGASKIKSESSKFMKPSLTDFLKGDFIPEAWTHSTYVEKEKPIICQFCNKEFPSEKKLSRHLQYHTAVTSWKCETCKVAFRNKFHLTQHIRVHTGEKPFHCSICTKAFSQRAGLVAHLQYHKGVLHECKICERTFLWQSGLSRHLKTHKDWKPHKCTECKEGFPTRWSMRKHIKKQHGL